MWRFTLKNKVAHVIAVILIVFLTFLIYSNTFYSPFIFDDMPNVVDNQKIRDLSNFLDVSGTRYIGFLSFALNYYFGGLNPVGYHLGNIIIHIINGVLLYILVHLTFKTPKVKNKFSPVPKTLWQSIPFLFALIVSVAFVSHPIQTQAITYISQRFASLTALFYLSAIVLYVKARLSDVSLFHRRYITFYLLSLIATVLAMKTKENSFTLPFIVILYDFIFLTPKQESSSIKRKRILGFVPYLLTLLIIPFSKVDARVGFADIITGTNRSEYLFTQFRVIVTYLRLFFFPVNQNLDYDYTVYHSFLEPQVFLSFFFLLSIASFALYVFYKSQNNGNAYGLLFSFGIFWFFITLSVESSVVPLKNLIFEHRVYLPSVGLFIAVTSAILFSLNYFVNKRSNIKINQFFAITVMALIIVTLLSVATFLRNNVWKDDITLWKDVVAKSPQKAWPYFNLGQSYMKKGMLDEAIKEYKVATKLQPVDSMHNDLGHAYAKKGWLGRAIKEYMKALRLNPDYAKAYYNLGHAYAQQGRLNEAVQGYLKAATLNRNYAEAHNNLGLVYAQQGRFNEAVREYQTALRLKPDLLEAYNNLAIYYLDHDGSKLHEAISLVKTALSINPSFADALNTLGEVNLKLGNFEKALDNFDRALEIEETASRHWNAALTSERLGLTEKAVAHWKRFILLTPDEQDVNEVRNHLRRLSESDKPN